MNKLFELMYESLKMFFDIIPRAFIVCADEIGIRFRLGKYVSILKPKLYFYIPLFTQCRRVKKSKQSLTMKKQSLTVACGSTIFVESMCIFRVIDIKKAVLECEDYRDIAEDVMLANVKAKLLKKTFPQICKHIIKIEKEICKESKKVMDSFGLELMAFRMMDITKCISLNNIQNITYGKGNLYSNDTI
jgi:hypothetical protein